MTTKLTNRQLAALETKRKLLDSAKKLVTEKGLVNTSIEEIAKASGVSTGTFYTHFKRKEDVIFELSYEMYEEITKQALAHEGDFITRLTFFMGNFSGYIEKSSLKLCQEWVRNTVDPDLLDVPVEDTKLYLDIKSMRQFFNDGIARGELKDDTPVEILAHTIIDILYGQMLCWDMSGGAYSFEARTREFCEHFLPSLVTPYLIMK